MTQELFKTKETIEKKKLKQDIQEALMLWRLNAEEYRTIPLKYQKLLQKKRELGITPVRRLSVSVLKEYPKITLLEISDEGEAMALINRWADTGILASKTAHIQDLLRSDHSYVTLKEWIKDHNYLFSKIEYEKAKEAALCQASYAS